MQDNASDTPPPAQDLADSGISEAVEGEILWISEAAPDGSAFDVMIIEAGTSKNGRRYSDDVLRRSAPLFEGQGVYAYEVKPGILDHLGEADKATVGDGGGGVRNLVGALEGVKFGEANGRRGLVARMSVVAPWARQLFKGVWESGKRHLLGFSIDARAKVQQTIEGVTDVVEIAPGIAINRVMDFALKRTDVRPGMQIVERAFGVLEVHSDDQGMVRAAGEAVLQGLEVNESDRLRPRIVSSEIITGIDDYQAMLINRMRHGQMILHRETLYILEVHPAGYALIAANEAEKASPINVLEVVTFGAFGRLWLGGGEAEIEEASKAINGALSSIKGRPNEGTPVTF